MLTSCNHTLYSNINKQTHFDIDNFKKNNDGRNAKIRLSNKKYILLSDYGSYYNETIKDDKSAYFEGYDYYKKNLSIKGGGHYFHGIAYGVFKEYNEDGIIIKQTDYDAPFKFSIESLIKKVKKETGIDISKPIPQATINRTTSGTPHYVLILPLKDVSELRYLTIDGTNGDTLTDQLLHTIE